MDNIILDPSLYRDQRRTPPFPRDWERPEPRYISLEPIPYFTQEDYNPPRHPVEEGR